MLLLVADMIACICKAALFQRLEMAPRNWVCMFLVFLFHALELCFSIMSRLLTLGQPIVSLPAEADFGMIYYNMDILNRYGFDAPPKDIAELETQMTTIIQAEHALENYGLSGITSEYTGRLSSSLSSSSAFESRHLNLSNT